MKHLGDITKINGAEIPIVDVITGGSLHGKDLSKADVTLNICAYLEAQNTEEPVEMYCAIGDEKVNGVPYHKLAGCNVLGCVEIDPNTEK